MDVDVVIVGAGPTGLMLACELGLADVRPIVLERLTEPSDEAKANGLLGQVVRMVDHRGLYERLSGSPEPPRPAPYFMFAGMGLDLGLLDDNPIYTLPVPQHRIVQLFAERAIELGAQIRWGHGVVGLSQDADAVGVDVAGPDGSYRLPARYLVGADGAHSMTRKLSGIGFPGVSYDRTTSRWAHVSVPDDWLDPATGGLDVPGHGTVSPFIGIRTEHGTFSYAPLPGRAPMIATTEWDRPVPDGPMSLAELRESVGRVLGADVPMGPPTGDGPHALRRLVGGNNRRAERFRDRRVFLVGDAAHVDAAGGQGLNLGLQDALNLGWKLAAQLRGDAPAGLLDSYDSERQLAARRVTGYAQALSALLAPGSDVTALRELFGELLEDRSTVQRLAALTAGTDIRYDMAGVDQRGQDGHDRDRTHPLVGRCAPELNLHTPRGPVRLAELTRTARPLLLDLTTGSSLAGALTGWDDRVTMVAARPELTGHDSRAGQATALLLRPDCYVAWASDSATPDAAERAALRAAAGRWFGSDQPSPSDLVRQLP
ncbi:FAD-dependent monooxygenase [Pseudonocardia asaccharolytica]|uniref:FAD-dependent oxidoreductase n=1 Tax=Pseudonocardia asaccharolytica DSM 44247 = NBRC 16224 TaxID=1123024 RepID=A0A511CXM4_9PSEU|nr:FAD-dependent monooxygenase [Pseudonocardia asaccharolytica]GEL17292.1 FAD-dependent oxidoreductase [Pseudonocardia asaccharolytica DSM 44247 = NBRC 16224]